MSEADDKEKHLKLAGVVKGVHAKLRNTFKRSSGDHEGVWTNHLKDASLLTEYADAMHHLATDIWTKHPQTRIDWCRDTIKNYLFRDDGLKKQIEKDRKRKYFADLKQERSSPSSSEGEKDEQSSNPTNIQENSQIKQNDTQDHVKASPEMLSDLSGGSQRTISDASQCSSLGNKASYSESEEGDGMSEMSARSLEEQRMVVHAKYQPRQYTAITIPFQGRIRLLDVGSCYNPFIEFSEFMAVGIDISPAVDSVHYCDFLHVETHEPLEMAPDSVDSYLRGLRSPIAHLPRNIFHVIVFSLLLEYFPSSYQRWICCQKARELLMMHGLLVIITPDSHHVNKNAKMMKSWKNAIESMGFRRWRYEKQEHLHCMAFRKVELEDKGHDLIGEAHADMLYIPQDFKDIDDTEEVKGAFFASFEPYDDMFIQDGLNELPDYVE